MCHKRKCVLWEKICALREISLYSVIQNVLLLLNCFLESPPPPTHTPQHIADSYRCCPVIAKEGFFLNICYFQSIFHELSTLHSTSLNAFHMVILKNRKWNSKALEDLKKFGSQGQKFKTNPRIHSDERFSLHDMQESKIDSHNTLFAVHYFNRWRYMDPGKISLQEFAWIRARCCELPPQLGLLSADDTHLESDNYLFLEAQVHPSPPLSPEHHLPPLLEWPPTWPPHHPHLCPSPFPRCSTSPRWTSSPWWSVIPAVWCWWCRRVVWWWKGGWTLWTWMLGFGRMGSWPHRKLGRSCEGEIKQWMDGILNFQSKIRKQNIFGWKLFLKNLNSLVGIICLMNLTFMREHQ